MTGRQFVCLFALFGVVSCPVMLSSSETSGHRSGRPGWGRGTGTEVIGGTGLRREPWPELMPDGRPAPIRPRTPDRPVLAVDGCAAVVHHAGAGTTAAGLRAGVPAVPVPVMADQPFWASRLHALGVAPGPLPFQDLNAGALGEAITTCLSEPAHRRRAAELSLRIAAENGTAAVLAHIGSREAG
ncbi:UDP-glucoronosyl/UDP-glucosyl transferase [Kitasatospora cineracea]|uniref:UDP-glucoronosyl/UDP-glucosyl transferase n=2 Tax=Kitasatospora cineracea TaxID=88074 RepID=A0A8G1USB5_9ACTN|nr:UDP-glucoronosyl/UDP-glucosyl transferase [Kitasatospora cineracea]